MSLSARYGESFVVGRQCHKMEDTKRYDRFRDGSKMVPDHHKVGGHTTGWVSLGETFFTHLKEGMLRLEALRLARDEIRKAGYDHPFFWAPFILVGEVNGTSWPALIPSCLPKAEISWRKLNDSGMEVKSGK